MRFPSAAVALAVGLLVTSLVSPAPLSGQDHPLIKPYTGSTIWERQVVEFDEAVIPLGPGDKDHKLTQSQRLEGKITRLNYKVPEGRSILEVYRNYETALKQAGFEVLYTCGPKEAKDCGPGVTLPYWFGNKTWVSSWESRYLTARLARPEGDAWVAVESRPGHTYILVVETKPMETGMVTVNAAALAGDITRAGHVAVYGIHFDTDKADLKPESDPVLAEIGKLLQENPSLKLYVVGHTDSVGQLTYNLDLSKRRAEAVVAALVNRYKIAAARLHAEGVGPLAPVAPNTSDEGRAQNRRVELVQQ
ncbi:MAG TPA: DUF4892 domain-containing protein [Candidatus Acidoferrales bacterium]|nr:DUF4892 domain-containing protein [Candidatus Acidoferrales bacterium]